MMGWFIRVSGHLGRGTVGFAEEELHGGALTRSALDPCGAPRLARHAVDHREAKAGSLADFLRREERLEGSLDDLGRHPDARVADAELDIFAVLKIRVAGDLDRPCSEIQDAA